jgi:hypothetical protein
LDLPSVRTQAIAKNGAGTMVSGPLAAAAASSPFGGIGSFLQNIFQPDTMASSTSSSTLGTLWQAGGAAQAYEKKDLQSVVDAKYAKPLRVTFRNCGTDPLLLCWVDEKGVPHHFHTLEPTDVVAESPVTADDETHCSWTGHAFLLAHCATPELFAQAVATKSLDQATVMGGYRPREIHSVGEFPDPLHIVTIQRQPSPGATCGGGVLGRWCLPGNCMGMGMGNNKKRKNKQGNLRKRKKLDEEHGAANGDSDSDGYDDDEEWFLSVRTGEMDPTPLDTTQKVYQTTTLGGWPVKCETCWHGNDSDVKELLEKDLKYAGSCFPNEACQLLKQDTYIWVNRSLTYGKAACPTRGSDLCFHPDPNWLQEMGCHVEKGKCVELYDILQYCTIRQQWGAGGVLIHELSHAYHNKVRKVHESFFGFAFLHYFIAYNLISTVAVCLSVFANQILLFAVFARGIRQSRDSGML